MVHQQEETCFDSSTNIDSDTDIATFVSRLSIENNISWIEKKLKFWIEEASDTLDFEYIFYCLFKTHRLTLNKSIQICIQNSLLTLYKKNPEKCIVLFINTLNQKVVDISKKTVSMHSIFILLKWTNSFILNLSINVALAQKHLPRLILNQSALLELYLSSSAKQNAKSISLHSVQKTLEDVFIKVSNKNVFSNLNICIEELIKIKKTDCVQNTVLLGMIAKIVFYSQSKERNEILVKKKDRIIDYYIKNVIESQIPLSKTVIAGLSDFFTYFITFEDFESKILLNLEKALLRTPEIILNGILKELILSLSPTIDISKSIYEKLLIPILNALKSSDANICRNSLETFELVIKKCTNHDYIQLIMEKIVFTLESGALFSLNHKLLHIKSLTYLPKSLKLTKSVLSFLVSYIYRETNENISIALIESFFSYFTYIISVTNEISDDYIKLIKNGFMEIASEVRRTWFNEFGNIIWNHRYNLNKQIMYLIEKVLILLWEIYKNILINPLQSIQNKTTIEGYLCTVIFVNIIYNWKNENISNIEDSLFIKPLLEKHLLSFENTPHFVFWDKIYTKNFHKDDKIWFMRSLETIAECIPKLHFQKIGFLWAQASFSLVLSNISHNYSIIFVACNMIKCCYLKSREHIFDIFLSEFWKHIKQLEISRTLTEKDAAIINTIRYIINAISPNNHEFLSKNEKKNAERQLIKTIVLYHHPLLTDHSLELINTIDSLLWNSISKLTLLAIRLSISTLVSLDQIVIVPMFTEMFLKYLSHLQFENISEKDISIWKDKKCEKITETNFKIDHNPIKKNIQQKNKLNKSKPDEKNQILSNELSEKTINSKILNIKSQIISGLTIIQGLALATQKNRNLWYSYAIHTLLSEELLEKGPLIVHESIVQTYLEPLQMMRLLSYLNSLVKQRLLDEISFIYILPFLIQIIKKKGVETDDFEKSDKQVMLALNIFSLHIDFCKLSVSRVEIIQALLSILYHFPNHFDQAKDCLILLCKTIKNNITKEEISELIKESISSKFQIRNVILQAIEPLDLSKYDFFYELYLTAHDKNETNALISLEIMKKNNFLVTYASKNIFIDYLCNDQYYIRECAAKAILSYVKKYPHEVEEIILRLIELYKEKSKLPQLEYDNFNIMIPKSSNKKDIWKIRSAIALSLSYLIPYFTSSLIPLFLEFLIGISSEYIPLNDDSLEVRQKMLENGLNIISHYGDSHAEELFKILDNYLIFSDEFLKNKINERVIILYGRITNHLNIDDQRVHVAIGKLMSILKSPSEDIQIAIAECFSLLIKFSLKKIPNYIERLKEELFTSEKYAERKGAAYGLAGIIKGGGIELLEKYEIIKTLKTAITNKKDQKYRQGALFAIESFSQILEEVFEPYIIEMIPYLLTTFGDPIIDVRESTTDAAKIVMSKISKNGIELILPSLLLGLNDNNWRIKKGSIDFIGAMAYCAPYQLSSSLLTIIPRLAEMINDSHSQVRLAGNESLLKIGKTINNLEIQKLIPTLLKALSHPNTYTELALDLLLKSPFTCHIDSPSLAIIMPVLEHGLKERSITLKNKSVKILEKISYFVEANDLIPYMDNILLNLRRILIDPVSTTRTISAKALGVLVKNLGEINFHHLISDLLSTLKENVSSIDRHGSAQGISEILSGFNIQYLENIFPEILENASSPISYIKEGYISLFIYLPQAFGQRFQPYIGKIISPILLGLASDLESVREVSLSAGKVIINNYAAKALDLLLPELQNGIFNENWRIRLGSIQLLGDLLFHITGISDRVHLEGNTTTTRSYKNILLDVLGQEKRDYILASLYVIRQDFVEQVQFSALNIWKALVTNTSKTIKEILPVIIKMTIYSSATSAEVYDTVLVKTLGELVKKLGEDMMPHLLLPLQEGMNYSEATAKVRICIALTEIIRNSDIETLEPYKNGLIKTIQYGLIDVEKVRKAIAQMFNVIYELYGNAIINQILPNLLDALHSNQDAENELEALKELIYVRSQNILPILIPKITKVPLSTINARIISSFAEVSASNFKYYLSTIINAFVETLILNIDQNTELEIKNSINKVLLSVYDSEGINILIPIMLGLHENWKKQVLACQHMVYFFEFTKQDYSKYFEECIYVFLSLFDDKNKEVVKSAWEAQNAFITALKKEDIKNLVGPTQKIFHNIGMVGNELKAFQLPKGINAILPIFMQGIIYGDAYNKELAAMGISDIVKRANPNTLDPFVMQITGPLIRTMGEQYSIQVKLAVLDTLDLLLKKIPLLLKPFLPQLQRTFLKCLSDPISNQLRLKAASALKKLIVLRPRLESLLNELAIGSKNINSGVKHVMIKSLFNVVSSSNFIMNETSKSIIYTLIEDNTDINDFQILAYIGRFSTILFKYFDKNNALSFLCSKIFVSEHNNYSILTLNAVLIDCPKYLIELNCSLEIVHSIINGCLSNKPYITNNGILAAGKFLLDNHLNTNSNHTTLIIETLVNYMKNPKIMPDANRLILTVISATSKKCHHILKDHFNIIVPIIFHNVHHILTPIQFAAESAYISLFKISPYDQTLFNEYITTLDSTQTKVIIAYHKRIMAKISTIHKLQNNVVSHSEEDYIEITSVGLSFTSDNY
ncbi:hypothetical protein PMAC_002889 [Pneumocystis sp. 'macacae']|nr:hypothetical protein PMAC_002889 [Pneumocystis sp. 'macacae']